MHFYSTLNYFSEKEYYKNQTFEISYKSNHYILNATGLETNGTISRILLVEINITQQKRAEAEIKKAFEKERQLNELKSRFVAMASHEFRTPLSTILSSTNLIMKYLEHPQGREKIIKHGQKVMTSVKNLYDSYIRAIRWASDRVGESGIIGFVTNAGFIDSNAADGLLPGTLPLTYEETSSSSSRS